MTRAVIESVINEFLDSKKPEVLAISGKWGVGKTYALKEMVKAYKGENSLAWYSYVSAFGAKSIGDLRSMILVKARPFPVKKGRVGDAVEEAEALFAKGRGGAIYKAAMALLERVPYGGKHVTVLLETVATSLIRKTVVCIDDIERLGLGIAMDELMGLVSELKVESQCKIILLFNEAQLGERAKQYEQASEKVVDKKLAFVTTASEALDLGLPADTPLREYVVPCVERLGISNIRTVQRIANGLRTIHSVIPNCSGAVKQQAAIAVAVFAGALYEGGIGFPNPEEVVSWNWYSHAMGVGKDTIEESWRDKLHACGFLACDEFDTEVLSVLKNGYVHGSELARYANELDEVADRARLDGIFTEVWNTFHNRIDGTADELMRKFVSAVEVAATVISPLNLNNTVKLLRELGFSAEADEVIEKYVELNASRTGLFKIDDSPWSKDIDDEGLRQRFAKVMAEEEGPLDLATVAALLLEDGRWDDRMQETLLNASPDDFVALLKENQGEAMRKLIDFLYRVANFRGAETAPIAVTVSTALDKIANESRLNEIRAKRWRR
ncbi:P-loop NTPase fold protein [Burkholderia cepacia]|uniref:P-loop NTPase fold protein n=1 Tax=Burkholderia cepacia TaxID=292 RepID=UPI001CF54C83|nr:P-loop NTPase fold protein [Burkholderia cepacia]MCA7941719.1 KAP family NTPase [Burkholderia cepacia]